MITTRELRAVEKACQKFQDAFYRISYTVRPSIDFSQENTDFKTLNEIAMHYGLTIYYITEKCITTLDFGPNFFIRKYENFIRYHKNVGQLLKLPAGLSKLSGPIHDFQEILKKLNKPTNTFDKLCYHSDLESLEDRHKISFEIWSKSKTNNCKSDIKCIRKKLTKNKIVKLHLDPLTQQLFLITDNKLYFRSYLKKMKSLQTPEKKMKIEPIKKRNQRTVHESLQEDM